jgi:predicted dehydrogenase
VAAEPTPRRDFLKSCAATIAAAAWPEASRAAVQEQRGPARIRFAAIGLNHSHVYGQIEAVRRGGGELVSFFAPEQDLAAEFSKRFPAAKRARSALEILEDPNIQLIVSASIPNERAPLGIDAMRHGKDFMVDKPGATTMAQVAEVRRVQAETKRIYSVLIERHESKTITRAGELVKKGAIGRVVQTVGLAPHRMDPAHRPAWFFEREKYGGILCDLASHNLDAFLFITGSTHADIVASQVANVHHPEHVGLEDFGDVMLRGNGGTGYIRVDWFTPGALETFGDGRLTILGTDGYIELRKNVDIGGRPGGNHLFLVDQTQVQYIDCSAVPLTYGTRLVDDVLNRTETAASQAMTFLAMELGVEAESQAKRVTLEDVRGPGGSD